MNKRNILMGALLAGAFTLAGCSGHPGTGEWLPVAETDSPFVKLTVSFEGKAELFVADRPEALLRCFWAAQTKHTMGLQCSKKTEEQQYHFTFDLTGDSRGELRQKGELVATFDKQA